MTPKKNFKLPEAGEDSRSRQIYSASPLARRGKTPPRLGFYSGTFDPVHVGHIEFALAAAEQFGLAKVLLLPEDTPHVKNKITKLSHRQAMLKLAAGNYKNLQVVTLPTKRFTVAQTLPLIQATSPSSRLVYLCGSDVVKTFLYRWEGLKELLDTADIVVGLRGDDTVEDMQIIFDNLQQKENIKARCYIVKSPKHHLSSTTVRSGSHIVSDIDPKVASYILNNKLYS